MSFSLSNLQSALRGGMARPNLFAVEIGVPALIRGRWTNMQYAEQAGRQSNQDADLGVLLAAGSYYSDNPVGNWFVKTLTDASRNRTSKDMPFIIEAAEFPGRTIAAVEDNYSGPPISMPNDMTYNDITLTFLAAAGMRQRSFFDVWMEGMVVPGTYYAFNKSVPSSGRAGTVAYYDDCITDVKIHQLSDTGQIIATTYLNNAYPTSMSSMNLSWEERDTYQRFTVTFNYRYHNVNYASRDSKF